MHDAAQAFIRSPHRLLIGGVAVESHASERIVVTDPSTGEEIASVPAADEADIDRAVKAAHAALSASSRAGWSPARRSQALWALADAIEKHAEEFAHIETVDVGKPIRNARNVDVPVAVSALRYFAGWPGKVTGETLPVSMPGDVHAFTVREPIGVVGQIIPWNYPLMGAVFKIAPALAAGCAVVLKPAEQTPLSALRLGELANQVGVPPGMMNVVTGYGRVAGAALVEHPDVAKISFTGSTATGQRIVRSAAATMKRVTVELGGKSPVIVMPDANLPLAAQSITESIFFNTGQTCSAGSRLLAHRAILDELVDSILGIAARMRVGPAMDETTEIGPVVSASHLDHVMRFIDQARADGARVIGGARRDSKGYFVEPAVVTGVRRGMSVVDAEIFGPVLSVIPFETTDLDEIAEEANATVYGLAAYVWTNDLNIAHGLIRRIKAGTVRVNTGRGDFAVPLGGYKQSGFGREMGRLGVEAYTEVKSVTLAYGS